METILTQLKINESIYFQFIIATGFFFIFKFIFLDKLKEVIEAREEKTSKKAMVAKEVFQQANQISERYNALVNEARDQAYNFLMQKKKDVMVKEMDNLKKIESELARALKDARLELSQELQDLKVELLRDTEKLSVMLINKFLKQ